MALGTEMTLHGFFRSPSHVHAQSTNELRIQWSHRRRVFRRTRTGIPTLTEDEPLGPSCCSLFSFNFGHFSDLQLQMRHSLATLNFPPSVCNLLDSKITSFALDFVAGRPSPLYPSIMIVADINFIERHCVDYIRRPLEFNQPRSMGAASFIDETLILGTLTEEWGGSEVDYIRQTPDLSQPHSPFLDETYILGISTEGWEDDEVDNNDVSDSTIEMLRRRRGRWATKGGEEENCSVCLERFSDAAEVITLPCDHIYHDGCILNWVKENQACPLCRRQI